MKWLFLLLVIVNIAIFVWGVQREADTSTKEEPRYRNIGEIKLLSEADIEELTIAAVSEKEVIEQEQPVSITEQLDHSEEKAIVTSQTISSEDLSSAVEPPGKDEAVVPDSTDLPEKSDESTEIEIPSKEILTSETDESSQIEKEISDSAEEKPITVQETFCWTLGPIIQKSVALTTLEKISEVVASADFRETTGRKIKGYWVVLPPYESARESIEAVKQLKARDVVDVQRFYSGEFQNGVSLGVYNRRFNAEKRQAQIEKKGFSPEVLPRYKDEIHYWIDYRSGNESNVSGKLPSEYRNLAPTQQNCDVQVN
ncbi:MAG: SPOR domain-containing protein [Gammaproteobacteria bacterium]|nr:SPOR domain-containing protein [Gammaproteobacteria bacterium]